MKVSMIASLWLMLGALAILLWTMPLPPGAAPAFAVGEALFGLNVLGWVVVSRWWLATASGGAGTAGNGIARVFIAMGGKILMVSGGVYVALVTCDLRVDFFVGGLCAGLGLLTSHLYLSQEKRKSALAANN